MAAALAVVPPALAERTPLKPGWNLFSPAQDIQFGQQVSRDAQNQIPMLNDSRVDNYLNTLGHRLAAHAPGYRYPYQYRCVNSTEINAFALPGGFIYINRGVIETADDEAQLAGVMAHETSHVALRHGTNQASKAYAAQVPLALLGGMLGGSAVGSVLAQLGASAGLPLVFLKFSRTDESQADILGTQILYDTGYDPRAMAQFFEKIEAESKSRPVEFFSDHPNPEHRIERVTEEVEKLGGPPANYKTDSQDFQAIKRYVKSLPPPPKSATPAGRKTTGSGSGAPQAPSAGLKDFQNGELRLRFPDNWQSYGQGNAVTLVPDGGVLDDGHGNGVLAYGVIINLFEPRNGSDGLVTLDQATAQLIAQLQSANPHMGVARRSERMRLGGAEALSTDLVNDSPVGGREGDWLVTSLRTDGLLYIVCVAPQSAADAYEPAFQHIIDSVQLLR